MQLVRMVTENTTCLRASHLVLCVYSAPPVEPTCVHTETEDMMSHDVSEDLHIKHVDSVYPFHSQRTLPGMVFATH